MIVELPMKYSVTWLGDNVFLIEVPPEYAKSMVEILNKQSWVKNAFDGVPIYVFISAMVTATKEEIEVALLKLCEHVCTPMVEVDREVWDI